MFVGLHSRDKFCKIGEALAEAISNALAVGMLKTDAKIPGQGCEND